MYMRFPSTSQIPRVPWTRNPREYGRGKFVSWVIKIVSPFDVSNRRGDYIPQFEFKAGIGMILSSRLNDIVVKTPALSGMSG